MNDDKGGNGMGIRAPEGALRKWGKLRKLLVAAGVALPLAFGGAFVADAAKGPRERGAAAVDMKRQLAADKEPGTWMSTGRTYDEQRYSPLTQVNKDNVTKLGLAWFGDIDTERGQESTPVVVDGVLYVTSAWSKVFAYDAKTGEKLWEFDPKVDRAVGQIACCDVVNRGVAAWKGKIYLGALDGRLIALDGKTGKVVWSVWTSDPKSDHTITQVPRIAHDMVVIGNAGAEYSVRGYVSAYDAETGKMKWRFYTVPGKPGDPTTPELEMARKTWDGDFWKFGGGATAWDSIIYDPKTDLIFFGTGNGLSWAPDIRSPGEGTNLFTASIIAVDAKTGKYRWHYQSVPRDAWDYDVTNPLMTADIVIKGKKRHVLMQAPKTAFFYIWDAKTGELLAAPQFAPQNWALKIDLKKGPVVNPAARYTAEKAAIVYPGPLGAHNWHPMSYSPRTGLIYMTITENTTGFQQVALDKFKMNERAYNTGTVSASEQITKLFAEPGAPKRGNVKSYLQAFDPVKGKEVWRSDHKDYGASGTLVTATDLVFAGNHSGEFVAHDARTGQRLWWAQTQAKIVAAPSTYTIDGEQYVAILVGARGLPPNQPRTSPVSANNSRILVYKLGASKLLPTTPYKAPGVQQAALTLSPPLLTGTNENVIDGQGSYARLCAGCHGAAAVADKSIPDLRYAKSLHSMADWNAIVIGGTLRDKGMASFKSLLSEGESEDIFHYVIAEANKAKAAEEAARRR